MDTTVKGTAARAVVGGRRGDPVDRLRPGQRAPRKGVAPGALVVRGQCAAGHAGHRGVRRRARPELQLVDRRDRARRAHRHAVHGVPLRAGPEAGPAADDPVPAAVRLLRVAAAGRSSPCSCSSASTCSTPSSPAATVRADAERQHDHRRTIIIRAVAFAWAIFGYRLIHVFCQWASVLFIVVYVLFGIGLARGRPPAGRVLLLRHVQGRRRSCWSWAPSLSYQLTWAPYVSEYSRYLPRSTSTAVDLLVDLPRLGDRGRVAGRARRLPGRGSTRRSRRRSPRSTWPGTRGSTAGATSCCCARGPA